MSHVTSMTSVILGNVAIVANYRFTITEISKETENLGEVYFAVAISVVIPGF